MTCVENQPFHSWMARTDFTLEKPEKHPSASRDTQHESASDLTTLYRAHNRG